MKPRQRKIELHKMLFLLPNMITLPSIFCGFDAILIGVNATSDEDYYRASLLLVFSLFFDILDGRVARLTKTQSAFGLQLDSLADALSFGVAPALLMYQWSLCQRPVAGLFCSFLFAACGILRLARFNVLATGLQGAPVKPGKYMLGLPIPGAAGVLVSLVLANHAVQGTLMEEVYIWPLAALMVFLSLLMVSTVRFRSFKDIQFNARTVTFVLFAVISSTVISFQTKPVFVLLWLLSCYVGLGLFETTLGLVRRRHEQKQYPEPSLPEKEQYKGPSPSAPGLLK